MTKVIDLNKKREEKKLKDSLEFEEEKSENQREDYDFVNAITQNVSKKEKLRKERLQENNAVKRSYRLK